MRYTTYDWKFRMPLKKTNELALLRCSALCVLGLSDFNLHPWRIFEICINQWMMPIFLPARRFEFVASCARVFHFENLTLPTQPPERNSEINEPETRKFLPDTRKRLELRICFSKWFFRLSRKWFISCPSLGAKKIFFLIISWTTRRLVCGS